MPDQNTFKKGQRIRVVTASGLRFAGPVEQADDDGVMILDEKTQKHIAFSWRSLERAEEM